MSVSKSTTLNEIYNSRRTLLKYLKGQNYDTEKYENFTISEISAMEQASHTQNTSALLNPRRGLQELRIVLLFMQVLSVHSLDVKLQGKKSIRREEKFFMHFR